MSPLERRCRLLLRAWPWRDRWERGDELVGTMLDVIGEDREWPPPGLAADMVVAGIRAHRRRRPPLSTYLWFIQGGRMEYRWHEWMLDRLLAPGWRRRLAFSEALRMFTIVLGTWLAMYSEAQLVIWVVLFQLGFPVVVMLLGFLRADRRRAKILREHGYALEGSPPRVVSHLVWAERPRTIANIRPAPVMVAAGAPLLVAGVLAIIDRTVSSNGPTFTRLHLPLFAIVVVALAHLSAVALRARRVPDSPGRPTAWTGPASALTAVGIVAVEAFFLSELPSGAWGFAGGVVGIAISLLAGALVLNERRIGRPIGLWDLYPRLGPVTVPVVELPLRWGIGRLPHEGEGQETA